MIAIRKLGYAALLAAAIFNYSPTLALAEQPSRGRFTLLHEVQWEGATVPAGEYEFSYDPDSLSPVLTITKINGPRASFMLMVPSREDSATQGSNVLVLESIGTGSYVSAMRLPESGLTLYFRVPHATEKQMAKALATVASAGQ